MGQPVITGQPDGVTHGWMHRPWRANAENWNILVSAGKEINRDSVSSGERKRISPNPAPIFVQEYRMFYVYVMVEKKTQKEYIGFSTDLKKRVSQHQKGWGAKSTKHGDWHLAYYEAYLSEKDARDRERKLKHYGQSRTHLFQRIKHSLTGWK